LETQLQGKTHRIKDLEKQLQKLIFLLDRLKSENDEKMKSCKHRIYFEKDNLK
jgi:hypothetical protein